LKPKPAYILNQNPFFETASNLSDQQTLFKANC
jgi:hypothetical protein